MARPNTYIQLRQAQQTIKDLSAKVELMKGFTLQQSLDMALITLHREFGFGPDRCQRFGKQFMQTFVEYAQLCVNDSADDEDIVYTQAVVDRELEEACGEIIPFEQRYAPENLYFRQRDLEEAHNGDL